MIKDSCVACRVYYLVYVYNTQWDVFFLKTEKIASEKGAYLATFLFSFLTDHGTVNVPQFFLLPT
jgi:hypothetical protein